MTTHPKRDPDQPVTMPHGAPTRHGTDIGGIPLGRWAGVPVAVDWSALLMVALFTWLLAVDVLPIYRPGNSTIAYWLAALLTAQAFLASLLAHELAHTLMARRYGMTVRRISLWIFGGLTDLDDDPPSPRSEAMIAAAGPVASLIVGLIFAALASLPGLVGSALAWLAAINIMLAIFNLLPGAPLDGGRLLRAMLWGHYGDRMRAALGAARVGQALGAALLALGLLDVLTGSFTGLWIAIIGWFVASSAAAEWRSVLLSELRDRVVGEIMTRTSQPLPNWYTVERLLDQLSGADPLQPAIPLIDFAGDSAGLLALEDLHRVRPAERAHVRLRDIARDRVPTITTDTPVIRALPALRYGVAIGVENRRPVGLLTEADLIRGGTGARPHSHSDGSNLAPTDAGAPPGRSGLLTQIGSPRVRGD